MTMPSSGTLYLSQVNTELGRASTQAITMNDSAVRTLAGVGGSGTTWYMSSLYGKSSAFSPGPSNNVPGFGTVDSQNANMFSILQGLGWNGSTPVNANFIINSGVVISANSTGQYALRTGGAFPAGSNIAIYNYGYIIGMGGAGGNGSHATQIIGNYGPQVGPLDQWAQNGFPGGPALGFDGGSVHVTLYNYGIIGGGGGGGGGAVSYAQYNGPSGGGGRSGRTNSATGANGWGYQGSFAGAGPGLVPSGNGNSGPGGNWGSAGGYGSDWPGDNVASYGGAGGSAVVNSSGFSVPAGWGTYYGAIA